MGAYFNGTFPNSPPGDPSGWAVENAFPNLTFTDPMMLSEIPGLNEFMVVGKNGQIWRFPKNAAATMPQRVLVADLTARVETSEDQGFYSLSFHPQFTNSSSSGYNKVYVCYNRRAVAGVDDNDRTYWTVSRFTWLPASGTLDPDSESILISQYDPHRFHNGGATFFGDDGFLYITAGDGGLGGDALDNSQRTDLGFFGGVLRIDVDNNPAKSHAIRRQPTESENWWLDNPTQVTPKPAEWPSSHTQGYGIPNDNPWLAANGSVLEEFYAIGLRSPHSAHFDPVTDDIWVGEVGEANREELVKVTKGANCQWAYLEGTRATSKNKPNPLTGFDQPPHYEYDHSVGNSIIGGPRYRGAKWAATLGGKVIFGDHVRGKIWSSTVPASGAPVIQELNSSFDTGYKKGLCGFFTDSEGEIYMMNLAGANNPAGKIMKLAVPAVSAEPPSLLSQTGVFTNLTTLATAAGVIPYDVPNPLWSDAAAKKRWVILPNDGTFNSVAEDIVFSDEGNWGFPAGTVFVKHFEVNTDAANPDAIKRLETRFLICTANGGKYGFTYKWNAAGTDAELLEQGAEENFTYTASGGGTEQRTWSYPSRGDCMICHNDVSGQALGVRTATFNSKFHYPSTGRTANQLETFNALGAFNVTLTASQMENGTESRPLTDETAPLEHRIRSYLATNCSHCHQPGGSGEGYDARLGTPLELQNIINGIPERYEALGPDGRYIKPGDTAHSAILVRAAAVHNGDAMPPLAKNLAHTAGIAALQSYISGLDPAEFVVPAAPKARYVRVKSINGNRNFAAIREFQVLDGKGVVIPFGQLTIKDVDLEAGSNTASKIIDGSTSSANFWQTPSSPAPAPNHPHQVTIDLGSVREFGGYVYWPRTSSNGDGRIGQYQILYSEDYVSWSTFDSGTWSLTSPDPTVFAPGYNKRAARTQLAGPVVPVEGAFEATVVFDQDVTGFTTSDITVQNGTVTALRGSGYYYVASISPAPGATQVHVSIPVNAAVPEPLGSLAASKGTLAPQPLGVTILPDQQPPTTPGSFAGEPGLFSVHLSWTASSDNIGVTGYKVLRNGAELATVAGLSYTDNNVAVHTQYNYEVVALDALDNASVAAAISVTTPSDGVPPTPPDNLAGIAHLFSIQLSWSPSGDNLGVTDYQIWRNDALIATVAGTGYTDNDLLIDTEYYYEVIALDAAGNASAAATLTKSTLPDGQAPETPGDFAGIPDLLSVQLSWSAASDNVAVTDYAVSRNGVVVATVPGLSFTDNDLTPNTVYTYQVRALDARLNASIPAQVLVTTLADTEAPKVPGELEATPYLVSVQLSWQASTDNLGVTGYVVRRNGDHIVATVPGTGYTDNDLTSETSYTYTVRAIDAAGNTSAAATIGATTLADEEDPTTPDSFSGDPKMSSVELFWSASSDNLGVIGYRLTRDGEPVTTVPGLTYTDTGLQPATTYHYQLVAVDAKGNTSDEASVYIVTLPDTEVPSEPGNLSGTPDFHSMVLSWEASGDNVAVTGYQVRRGTTVIATVTGLEFTDTGLERGTAYHYEVRALDEAGNLSPAAVLNIATSGFEEWLDQRGLTGQAEADSDDGGVDNLTEYHLGMDPNDPHDDIGFRLVIQPREASIHVVFPELKPAGSYHLHHSSGLIDLKNVSKRIETLTRAQIGAMTPEQRLGHSVDVPKSEGAGFFLLIFDPPTAE
ncbi:PQQ-dependent sugar dehydrogenase [Luteolibacter sp. Populi]|uniref:PQQ-dependent sugar dehydrogenase n=1 Tax=Luteolibacter sp. Populi TaxID=3230487 RepID=UPI0034674B77